MLWVQRADHDIWNLPGGGCEPAESPWVAAVREAFEETGLKVEITRCTGIYVKPEPNAMIFNFEAKIMGGELSKGSESTDFGYFAPGEEPENTLPKQVERVSDAALGRPAPIIRLQSGPPGIESMASYSGRRGAQD